MVCELFKEESHRQIRTPSSVCQARSRLALRPSLEQETLAPAYTFEKVAPWLSAEIPTKYLKTKSFRGLRDYL